MTWGIVRECDSETVRQCAIRLSAYRCPLPAGHCHSERSEESRCVSLVIPMPINTSRREDVRPSDDRHQTYCIPERRGIRRLWRPGSRPRRGLAPGGLRFRPQSGLVQRKFLYSAACGGIYTHCREAAIHNPRPIGPSNLRTLRPAGPVNPKNLPP